MSSSSLAGLPIGERAGRTFCTSSSWPWWTGARPSHAPALALRYRLGASGPRRDYGPITAARAATQPELASSSTSSVIDVLAASTPLCASYTDCGPNRWTQLHHKPEGARTNAELSSELTPPVPVHGTTRMGRRNHAGRKIGDQSASSPAAERKTRPCPVRIPAKSQVTTADL